MRQKLKIMAHADYSTRTMDTGDHFKNGASPKSQMSRSILLGFGKSAVAVGCAAILTFCGCSDDDKNNIIDDDKNKNSTVPVTEVSLDRNTLTLTVGDEVTLTATVTPDNATNKTVAWTSSNESVATVSGGKVKALAAGNVNITAKAGEQTASCSVAIAAAAVAVTGISLDTDLFEFLLGELPVLFDSQIWPFSDVILTATVSPDHATDKTVTWTSSNTDVAIVDNEGKITVNTSSKGTSTITAKAGNHTATCEISVYDVFSKESVVINGVTWATRNVNAPGTFVTNPEDIGMVYQWGRKRGWSSDGPLVASDNSTTWDNSYYDKMYDDVPDGWLPANDPSPAGWRAPSYAQLQKLTASPHRWAMINGVEGMKFGSGENVIFLPAGFWRSESGTLACLTDDMGGACGKYWSNLYHVDVFYYVNSARALSFNKWNSGWHHENQYYFRAAGLHIRSVK
jgi:hypothetical protein